MCAKKFCRLSALLLGLSLLIAPLGSVSAAPSKESAPKIALTFDDGPSAQYTGEILDILQKYGVKATFFIIGVNAEKYPELLRRTIAEGHEIGNHTYSHPHLQKMDTSTLADELMHADSILQKLAGVSPTLFRPPEGVVNTSVKAAAAEGGYRLVLWTIDTRDWALNNTDNIIRLVDEKASDGDIILFHDWIAGKSPTPAALEILIPRLKEKGFEFVKVSDL